MYEQGYTVKRRVCPKCKHFVDGRGYTEDSVRLHPNDPKKWVIDQRNMRCGIGGFSVKLTATCNIFEFKDEDR